jgi:hypothetical protein
MLRWDSLERKTSTDQPLMMQRKILSEEEIYDILSNSRRRAALQQLTGSGEGTMSLRELSVRLASEESNQSPPPQRLRESVYSSLQQTHLPLLDELGVIRYDRATHTISLCDCAREVGRYMEETPYHGITWGELYRGLGIASLLVVLAALLEAPVVSGVDPILWTSGFLAAFAVAIGYQFWTNRWHILRALRG